MLAGVSDFLTLRDVPEDKIVTKDGDDAAVYSDDKLRVIISPRSPGWQPLGGQGKRWRTFDSLALVRSNQSF